MVMNQSLQRNRDPESIRLRERSTKKLTEQFKRYRLPPSEAARLIKGEVYPNRELLYGLRAPLPPEYITDVERLSTHTINKRFSVLLKNKLVSYQLLSNYINTPHVLASISEGITDFVEELPKGEIGLFFKPTEGAGGKGAFQRTFQDGRCKETGKDFKEFISFLRESGKSFLVLELVKQCQFMSNLFPHSVNTLRLLCYRDPETREPHIPRGIVRVGTLRTAPVDNFSQGGISFDLDISSGEIGPGRSMHINKGSTDIYIHPDTKERISGQRIPGISYIVETMRSLMQYFPNINYVGWDVCITDGGIVVIEANNTTDVDIFQVHRPLLNDEGLAAFFRFHKII